MEIKGNVEKNPENGKKRLLVYIDETESGIFQTALSEFKQFDKDDFEYGAKLLDLKDSVFEIWTLLHPS